MKTMVLPRLFWSSSSWSCMSRRISGSSALKDSSISSRSASVARARARPTRCCMPPDSSSGQDFSQPPSPQRVSASPARRSRSARGTPWTSRPYPAFSSTLRCGNSAKCWKTMLILVERTRRSSAGERAVRSSPSIRMRPAVGSSRPLSMRSKVDLPEPDRPITTKIWPGSTRNEASITAAVVPSARSSSRSVSPLSSARTAFATAAPLSGPLPNTLYTCSAVSVDTYTPRVVPETAHRRVCGRRAVERDGIRPSPAPRPLSAGGRVRSSSATAPT